MNYTVQQVKKHNNEYNWKQGCEFCRAPFGEDEIFQMVDMKVSIFRGDDEVNCYHNKCWNKILQAKIDKLN